MAVRKMNKKIMATLGRNAHQEPRMSGIPKVVSIEPT